MEQSIVLKQLKDLVHHDQLQFCCHHNCCKGTLIFLQCMYLLENILGQHTPATVPIFSHSCPWGQRLVARLHVTACFPVVCPDWHR